jgi:hypothetical protein
MKMKTLLFTLLAVLLLASCTTFKMSGTSMNMDTPPFHNVGELDIVVNVHEFLGNSGGANLFNLSATNMDDKLFDAIEREVKKAGGDAVLNLDVEYKASFLNILLNALTFNLYAPAEAHVTGNIIKYEM